MNAGRNFEYANIADIIIRRAHSLDHEHLKVVALDVAQTLQRDFGGRFRWESDNHLVYRHMGATARLKLHEADLEVSVVLGLMMRSMKRSFEQEIRRELDRLLA